METFNDNENNDNNINNTVVNSEPTVNYNQYSRNNTNYTPNSFKPTKPKKEKKPSRFFVPFISGMLGASLVIGICFGVPSVKSKLFTLNTTQNGNNTSNFITPNLTNTNLIDLTEYSNTAVSVANKVLPSVVGISVTYTINSIFGSSEGEATGSGIIISEDGYILTNNHVISTSSSSSSSYYQLSDAKKLTVHLYNDKTDYEAKVIGTDSYSDLAVLKIDAENLTVATLGNSENVNVGEFTMAIGNPLGMDSSVTCGVVSAVDREVSDSEGNTYLAIQTDAAINSGNSGGALVNAKGEVIGINTLKLAGSGIEGIGFAIPISTTTEIVNQLIEFQTVKRPYIGIIGTTVDESTITRYNFPEGVYIRTIEENSPAAQADLKVGDIITKIEGEAISTIEQLNRIKNTHAIGDTIKLTIIRNGEEKEVSVVLGETPETDPETIIEEPIDETPYYEDRMPSIWDFFNY